MAQQRVDWKELDNEINKTKKHHQEVTMSSKESDTLARLKMEMGELGIDWKENLCSREAIETAIEAQSEELELERQFIELMREFDLFNSRIEELESQFKDISANPTKSSVNEYFIDTWRHLKFMHATASDIEKLLQNKQTYFPQTLKDWIESKADSLLTKLNKVVFYSQEIFLARDQRRSADASEGETWFQLDLSSFYELKKLSLKQEYADRLSELIYRCVEKKLLIVYDRYGHVVKMEHDQENHRVYFSVKPMAAFDSDAIGFLENLEKRLREEQLVGEDHCQVSVGIIDHYLQLLADSDLLDKDVSILQHKKEFEHLIQCRNDLAARKEGFKKPIDFDSAFRDLGFSKEAASENDVQVMLWNLFGR